tara:strand:+ start:202 stop:540 length:339 start_codon:yes stop_codon:yes gene_type:complete
MWLVLWLFPSGNVKTGINGRVDKVYLFGLIEWLEMSSTNAPYPYKTIGPWMFSVHTSALVWTVSSSLLIALVAYGFAKSLPWGVAPNSCIECGYNLTQNLTGNCPECGTEIK